MIKGHLVSKLAAELNDGTFAIMADASRDAGGEGLGPDPHAILEAALAACTIITLKLYADRKSFALEDIEVEVKIVSESKEHTQIDRSIRFKGDLSDEQRTRLLEIADKCPIHRLLESQVKIHTVLA